MDMCITDGELVHMSTSDLRSLLDRRQVTSEEHKQLRARRRRLQNRRYARKCAMKKLTEVEHLATEVKEESGELQALQHQLDRLGLTTRRIQRQETILANVRQRLESAMCSSPDSNAAVHARIRMVHPDGAQTGFARLATARIDSPTPSNPFLDTASSTRPPIMSSMKLVNPSAIVPPRGLSAMSCSNMPLQLAAGPGMPSSTRRPFYSAWPPAGTTQLNARGSMHMTVRPVACGLTTHGRHAPEF